MATPTPQDDEQERTPAPESEQEQLLRLSHESAICGANMLCAQFTPGERVEQQEGGE